MRGGCSEHKEDADAGQPDSGVVIALTAERDTYRAMYESLLEKILGGAKT